MEKILKENSTINLEEVKIWTKGIQDDGDYSLFPYMIFGVLFLLYWGILNLLASNVLGFLFFLTPLILILIGGITIGLGKVEFNNTWYLFTNKKIIKYINRRPLNRVPSQHLIKFKDVDYIINWIQGLEIVPYGQKGAKNLKNNEIEFKRSPKGLDTILIPFQGETGKRIHQILFKYLKTHISLEPHPNIKYIYQRHQKS